MCVWVYSYALMFVAEYMCVHSLENVARTAMFQA